MLKVCRRAAATHPSLKDTDKKHLALDARPRKTLPSDNMPVRCTLFEAVNRRQHGAAVPLRLRKEQNPSFRVPDLWGCAREYVTDGRLSVGNQHAQATLCPRLPTYLVYVSSMMDTSQEGSLPSLHRPWRVLLFVPLVSFVFQDLKVPML